MFIIHHVMSDINQCSDDSTCFYCCITLSSLSKTTFQHLHIRINFTLCIRNAPLFWEGSSYHRKGTLIGVSISVIMHLVLKHMTQFIVLNLILRLRYTTIWHQWMFSSLYSFLLYTKMSDLSSYKAYLGNGLKL